MPSSVEIRDEVAADIPAIEAITVAAFRDLQISQHTEHFIVEALRTAGALSVSLVATVEGQVVGHVAFSPVTLSSGDTGWYGLGPISVLPDRQRRGIGTALIRKGLARLRAIDARGCCLVGHPDYYPRFGFRTSCDLRLQGVPAEFFLVLDFGGHATRTRGTVTFHDAFRATAKADQRP